MAHPAPSINRLSEILNGQGAAPTLQEVQGYLDPRVMQAMHGTEMVEARLREIADRMRTQDAEWQETFTNLLCPWREEIIAIEAEGRTQILSHATHAGEPRCDCWKSARLAYFAAIDKWAENRQAVAEFERLWEALLELSIVHRPRRQDDAAAIVAGVVEGVEEQITSALREYLPFVGRRRR